MALACPHRFQPERFFFQLGRSVCKGICSHVFDEGMEPYSEYRPDEVIDTIVAPLAVSARKVPEIFLTIFGNKVMIELKRKLKEIYEG